MFPSEWVHLTNFGHLNQNPFHILYTEVVTHAECANQLQLKLENSCNWSHLGPAAGSSKMFAS